MCVWLGLLARSSIGERGLLFPNKDAYACTLDWHGHMISCNVAVRADAKRSALGGMMMRPITCWSCRLFSAPSHVEPADWAHASSGPAPAAAAAAAPAP